MGELYVTQSSGSINVPIERVTEGLPVIDTNHAQIHAGNAYSIGAYFNIAAAGKVDLTVTIPANAYVHFQALNINSDGGNTVTISFFENTVLNATPGGTAITPVNRRRLPTVPVSVLSLLKDATITTDGTLLDTIVLPKSSSPSAGGSVTRADEVEWVLNPGSKYTFRIANTGATTAVNVNFRPFWYEEAGA